MITITILIAPAARASERGGILTLPHVIDASVFSKLIVFFFSHEKEKVFHVI